LPYVGWGVGQWLVFHYSLSWLFRLMLPRLT
jgi:hypothetical protein